ncbi:hypothetical protein ElyMa_006477200 [Elysia marginata]|uniref:Ig-like domain-containing protein n=1 Tax=Elysia marginata TaxID=1093978 RepID=A0AAV4HZL6_9GAST|nr:hypothetical protein ElyMa_006477200 [Elysia marginata]
MHDSLLPSRPGTSSLRRVGSGGQRSRNINKADQTKAAGIPGVTGDTSPCLLPWPWRCHLLAVSNLWSPGPSFDWSNTGYSTPHTVTGISGAPTRKTSFIHHEVVVSYDCVSSGWRLPKSSKIKGGDCSINETDVYLREVIM